MYETIYNLSVCLIDLLKGLRVVHSRPVSDPFFEVDYLHVLLVLNFPPSADEDMTVTTQLEKYSNFSKIQQNRNTIL